MRRRSAPLVPMSNAKTASGRDATAITTWPRTAATIVMMSRPPCRVCGGCPECGDCDCQVDAEDFYDDNEDETMKLTGYAWRRTRKHRRTWPQAEFGRRGREKYGERSHGGSHCHLNRSTRHAGMSACVQWRPSSSGYIGKVFCLRGKYRITTGLDRVSCRDLAIRQLQVEKKDSWAIPIIIDLSVSKLCTRIAPLCTRICTRTAPENHVAPHMLPMRSKCSIRRIQTPATLAKK